MDRIERIARETVDLFQFDRGKNQQLTNRALELSHEVIRMKEELAELSATTREWADLPTHDDFEAGQKDAAERLMPTLTRILEGK